MTRKAPATDATKGSAARSLSKRAVSVVDTRTRRQDPFASRHSVGMTLSMMRSRDPDTTPGTAIALAIKQDELVALPRPSSGRECLTVRDKRRLAACAATYRRAGEPDNARACVDRIEHESVPRVLDRPYVTGP